MSLPTTLYLIGFAGSGKYTIAREISKSGYKVIDNQLINNPIFALLDLDGVTPISEKAWNSISTIRTAVLDFASQINSSNFVFTNELCDVDCDYAIYNQVKDSADKRGSLFIPVKLIVSAQERVKRITSPERMTRFKTTSLDEAYVKKKFIKIDHPHLIELEVTDLSAAQTAKEILNYVESLQK